MQLALALIGLFGAVAGLGGAYLQLKRQSTEISEFKKAFRDSRSMRLALEKPLEGVWDQQIEYELFHNEPHGGHPAKHMLGKAVFIWSEDRNAIGYDVYTAGGIYIRDGNEKPIITVCFQGELITDLSGVPHDGFEMRCRYTARTSGNGAYENPTNHGNFTYVNGKVKRSETGRIIRLTLDFESTKSKGKVTMARK